MKNKTLSTLILSLAIVLMASNAFSQALFQNTYSSSISLKPMYSGPASGSGIIICGITDATPSNGFICKTNLNGVVQWTKKIGGSQEDVINVVRPTSDGGYIAVGYTKSSGAGDRDVLLIKLDASGNLTWSKTYGTTTVDVGYDVIQTSDGGFAAVGYARAVLAATNKGGFLVFKTNGSGALSWYKIYGEDGAIAAKSILQKSNGSLIVSGRAWGSTFITVQEINIGDGSINWAKGHTLMGPVAKVINTQIISGDSLIVFSSGSDNGKQSFSLLLLNPDGTKQWAYNYRNYSSISDDIFGGMTKTWNGYLVSGNSYGNSGSFKNPNMIWIDRAGNVKSSRLYHGINNASGDIGFDIVKLDDGTHITTGAYGSSILLIKSNWIGNMGCSNSIINTQRNSQATISGPLSLTNWGHNGAITVNTASLTATSLSLTKTTLCSTSVGIKTSAPLSGQDIKVFPNPFKYKFEINLAKEYNDVEITIYDVLSHIIYTNNYQSTNKITISRNNMASGVYFYQIKSQSDIISSGKVIAH